MPGIGYRVPAIEKVAPSMVPHRSVWWCLHCETVHRSVERVECPQCGAGSGDLWPYYDAHQDMPPAHWPEVAPKDGTVLRLYE